MNRFDLAGLQTFLTIAEQGSLRAAARVLGVNAPAVSHQLKAFEERLGTALFLRSTRSVILTDAGARLYNRSHHLVAGVKEALDAASNVVDSRIGPLRITLPYRAWQLIVAPGIAAFQCENPDIELDLNIDETLTDIVSHGFHAGIRLGDHLQDDMIAVRLTQPEEGAYIASPDYLARNGIPRHPEDLLSHDCIRHRQITSGEIPDWHFVTSNGDIHATVGGKLILNDLRTIVAAVRQGLGIGWSLKRGVQNDLDQGRLIQILGQYTAPRPGFFLYFPKPLGQVGVLRAFIEYFRDQ